MSVGIPGTGVGGLFYLISALLMPVREAYRATTGRSDPRSRGVVWRQSLIALGVLGGIWVTGWLIGLILGRVPGVAIVLNATPGLAGQPQSVVRLAAFVLAFGTLAVVLGTVEILGVVRRRRNPRLPEPASHHPSRIARPAA